MSDQRNSVNGESNDLQSAGSAGSHIDAGTVVGERDAVQDSDRRWCGRRSVELDADVTGADGLPFAAQIINLSEEGCMVRTFSGAVLDRHQIYMIKVTGVDEIRAYLVWSKVGQAGFVFAEPLHVATVRSLVMKSLYARIGRRMARSDRGNVLIFSGRPFPML